MHIHLKLYVNMHHASQPICYKSNTSNDIADLKENKYLASDIVLEKPRMTL